MAETYHTLSAPAVRISSPLTNLINNSRFGCCSSSTVAITGDEEVANGTFTSDTSSWSATDCTIASVAGGKTGNCLEITRTGGSIQKVTQTLTLEVNRLYRLTAYTKQGTSGAEYATISILDASDDSVIYQITTVAAADWAADPDLFGNFRAWVASVKIVIEKSSATAGTMLFDTVTVKEFVPAYVGADAAAPDGWYKDTTLTIYRQVATANVKPGSQYSLKLVPSAADDYFTYCPVLDNGKEEWYSKFAGKPMVMGSWVKTSTASHARLRLNDGVTVTFSNYHTGGGDWEWLEVAATFSDSATAASFGYRMAQTSGDVDVCQPMLSYGKVIGPGNWQPLPNEMVILYAPQTSLLFGGTVVRSDSTSNHIDVEADSAGVIPRGVEKIYVRANVRDSGSSGAAAWFKLRHHGSGGDDWHAIWSCGGLANDLYFYGGMQWCLVSFGVIDFDTEATGSGTLDVNGMFYCAVGY